MVPVPGGETADRVPWRPCATCNPERHTAWQAGTLVDAQARAEARFWSKVTFGVQGGCWLWSAARSDRGYGCIRVNRKLIYAHRFAYELLVGEVPEGMQLDHLCRVRHCVNPAHLEVVTQRENIRRGNGLSAQRARRTHCPQGHPYDEANTYVRPDGRGRGCQACRRAANLGLGRTSLPLWLVVGLLRTHRHNQGAEADA